MASSLRDEIIGMIIMPMTRPGLSALKPARPGMRCWSAGVMIVSMGLFRKVTALRVAAGVVAAPTLFFLLSNFAVWLGGMYAHTFAGLAQCYTLALPFYRNDLVSTGVTAVALFGLPALATRIAESFQPADRNIAA